VHILECPNPHISSSHFHMLPPSEYKYLSQEKLLYLKLL
jgi:hypothetical protein